MNSALDALKDFLESIPQFIRDLEPGDDYLKVPEVDAVWKTIEDFAIDDTDEGDGFIMSGRLVVPFVDLILFSGWHAFKSRYPGMADSQLYPMFLQENPSFCSEFNLEQFCEIFEDFYCEFLNDAGLKEGAIELEGNTIRLLDYSAPEDEKEDDYSEDEEDESEQEVVSDEEDDEADLEEE